jgi:excisionase family DNA binding protein
MSSLDPLLNIHEVAQLLSVSPRTVARLVASGHIESIHIGRARRVRPSAVSRYVDNLQKSQREKAVGF